MEETLNDGQKKGFPKKIVAIIIAAVLVIGGGVAAYVMLNLSDKEKYFLSEKKSMEFLTDKVEERFKPEFDWLEQTENNPTETVIDLSAEYNDPTASSGYGAMSPQEIINNSTITLTTSADMEKKQIASEIKGSFGDIEIDDVQFYLTDEKATIGLPFLEELLQVKDKDIGKFLHELDPMTFTGEENPNFEVFFKRGLSEEDQKYFNEEYLKMIYDKLPDSAFKITDETVKINDESVDTKKMTMHLYEDEVKDILKAIFEKMQKDDRLKEIMQEQIQMQQFRMPADASLDMNFDEMMNDFDDALKEAQDGLKDFKIPDGITSTIWTKDKLIVKREFSVEMGPTKDQLAKFTVNGTQKLEDNNQSFDYKLAFSDDYEESSASVTGDFSTKDDKATDSIKLSAENMELAYEGNSTLKDGKREFERQFSIDDQYGDSGKLIWTGNANYEKDKMSAEHSFSVEFPSLNITQEMASLHIKNKGKTIKSVEMPKEDNIKDLGSMNVDELKNYFETDVAPQAQQWFLGIMGGPGMSF